MPKKAKVETQKDQSERFKKALQDMIDAGELSPTEADANFDRLMSNVANQQQRWLEGEEDQESPPK